MEDSSNLVADCYAEVERTKWFDFNNSALVC